jgi:phosphatidate cytidylyltransferase
VASLKREMTAGAGIALTAAVLFLMPPAAFQVLAGVVVLLTSVEIAILYRPGTNLLLLLLTPALTALWASLLVFHTNPLWVLSAAFFASGLAVLALPQPLMGGSRRLFYIMAVPFFVGFPGGALLALRTQPTPQEGLKLVIFLLAVVWVSDSIAYYVGKNFGRHKISPAVSPNKTVEGTAALVIAAAAVTLAFYGWSAGNLLAGLCFGPVCFFGDLIQSLAKRDLGVKDSGTFFPGHGGFWDRTDSLLWAALAVHLWKSL